MVLNNLPTKLEDPSIFSIPCLIGNVSIDGAFCDLSLSVSLMSYSIFKRFDLGELRPTTSLLQLANCFVKYPLGILEDVQIKVGDFYVLVDFVILNMAKDAHT